MHPICWKGVFSSSKVLLVVNAILHFRESYIIGIEDRNKSIHTHKKITFSVANGLVHLQIRKGKMNCYTEARLVDLHFTMWMQYSQVAKINQLIMFNNN